MNEYQVPTARVPVEIHTDEREMFSGSFFAPELALSDDPLAEVAGLLNDERDFLPFQPSTIIEPGTRQTFLSKRHVVRVRLCDLGFAAAVEPPPGRQRCHIFLANGECVSGVVVVATPRFHSRVVDMLNRSAAFVTVLTDYGPMLINRSKVVQVV